MLDQLQMHFDRVEAAIRAAMQGCKNDLRLLMAAQRRKQFLESRRREFRFEKQRRLLTQLVHRVAKVDKGAVIDIIEAQRVGIENINFIQAGFEHTLEARGVHLRLLACRQGFD